MAKRRRRFRAGDVVKYPSFGSFTIKETYRFAKVRSVTADGLVYLSQFMTNYEFSLPALRLELSSQEEYERESCIELALLQLEN
jgi:hypothetical protein